MKVLKIIIFAVATLIFLRATAFYALSFFPPDYPNTLIVHTLATLMAVVYLISLMKARIF